MFPKLRTITLAGVILFGTLLVAGAGEAKAQFFVSTPGFSFGVGGYTPFGVLSRVWLRSIRPHRARPCTALLLRVPPNFYGPRPYYPHAYGYRRW